MKPGESWVRKGMQEQKNGSMGFQGIPKGRLSHGYLSYPGNAFVWSLGRDVGLLKDLNIGKMQFRAV